MSGPGRSAAYGGSQLWQWDASSFESRLAIISSLQRGGADVVDDDDICVEATRSLLMDVLDAAGGVEGANIRIHEAMARVEFEHRGEIGSSTLTNLRGVQHPATEQAWYSVEELMFWSRTFDERLCRKAHTKGFPRQGLIPALADGPRRDAVQAARTRMLHSTFGETRFLANLNLHMQSTNAGSKGADVQDGRLLLAFPDRVTGQIGHRWQLTYDDRRDAVSFADSVLTDVERFVDSMLGAFESHVP